MERFRTDAPIGPRFSAQGGNGSVADLVTPDMMHLVHPYWTQFAPMDPIWAPIIGFYLCVIGVVAWIGNGTVLYIFGSTPSLRTPANLLVMNLAFSDFLMMLTQSPPMVINMFYDTWVLGPLNCELYALFGSLFGSGSIWTMSMISLDRYNVIVKGITGKPMTTKLAIMKIVFIYSFSSIWAISPMLGWNRYVPEGNLTACGIDYMTRKWVSRSYIICYSFFVYYTPLFLICFAYYHILSTVAAHEKAMKEQAKKMNVKSLRSGDDANKSAEGKLAKVALTTISLWFIAWTPYLIINTLGLLKYEGLTPLNTILPATFAKASSVYNPLVYATSHPKYREALKEKCPCCVFGKVEKEEPPSDAGTAAEGAAA